MSNGGGAIDAGAVAVVTVDTVAGLLFNGAPTAISQRWPGSPCGGFIPGSVFTLFGTSVMVIFGCPLTVVPVVVAGAGLLFKGAPTAISQRWPGCPCGGFMPGAVTIGACVCVTICGLTFMVCGCCGIFTGTVVCPGTEGIVLWLGIFVFNAAFSAAAFSEAAFS